MNIDGKTKPPIDVEQWIDFIIASAAHRSHDPGHQKFGDMLIQRYFVTLPERHKEDAKASQYFDEMLCAVASSIRGFSVVRDMFQTNWEALKSEKEKQQKQLESLQNFSLLSKDNHWSKAIAIVFGTGLGPTLQATFKAHLGNSGWMTIALISVAIITGAILMEIILEWLKGRQSKRIETQYPNKVLDFWQENSLKGYRKVLWQFLPVAVEITNRHYPGSCSIDTQNANIQEIIERHFAFKMKPMEEKPHTK